MKTKMTIVSLLLLVSIVSFGQDDIDATMLRKAVLKSDVILVSPKHSVTISYANDYSIEQFYVVNGIDTIIKNVTQFKVADKIKIQQHIDDYSASWGKDVISAEALVTAKEIDTRYTDLLFLKKENKQYKLLGIVRTVKWDDFTGYYIHAINQIMEIGNIRNLNERYTKTIDWFIEHKDYPDDDFIAFYTENGILQNELILTDEQMKKVIENFMKGNSKLRPYIKDEKILKSYTLKKLKEIMSKPEPESWRFYYELTDLYDFKYGTAEYIFMNQLSYGFLTIQDRKNIMNYFIKKVEQELQNY